MSEDDGAITVRVQKSEDDERSKEELEKLRKENESLKAKSEDLEGKLKIIAEKRFEAKKKEAGCTDPEIDNPEKLKAWSKGRENKHPNIGSNRLYLNSDGRYTATPPENPQDIEDLIKSTESVKDLEFDSQEQMINVLQARAREGDNEAQDYLNKLAKKTSIQSLEIDLEWKKTSDMASGKEKPKIKDVKVKEK